MKALLGSLVVCLAVTGCSGTTAEPPAGEAAHAAEASALSARSDLDANIAPTNDRFNGAWEVDWEKSRYIEELKSRKSSPDAKGPYGVKEEIVTLTVKDNTEHCINHLIYEDGTETKSEYTATYNDGKWYPSKNLLTGEVREGAVMMYRLEPGRELRISRNADGKVSGFVLRTVLDDGTMRTMNLSFGRLYDEGTRTTDITLINMKKP